MEQERTEVPSETQYYSHLPYLSPPFHLEIHSKSKKLDYPAAHEPKPYQ